MTSFKKLERGKRIELSALAWKAKVLPLYEPRIHLVPLHRIELQIADYKTAVIPFNYKGNTLIIKKLGSDGGIRTLEPGFGRTVFLAGRWFQPLTHVTICGAPGRLKPGIKIGADGETRTHTPFDTSF